MKLYSYRSAAGASYGVLLTPGVLLDLPRAAGENGETLPADLDGLLVRWDLSLGVLKRLQAVAPRSALLMFESVRVLPPVRRPSKIVGVGMNYRDHILEQNAKPPKTPVLFAKFASCIIGPDDPLRWDPQLTSQVDFEAELAVVIGRRAHGVSEERALDVVAGYTVLNDLSARDLQFGDRQWTRGKSLDGFCPLGPALVTADEIPDPQQLSIRCTLNGETMQESNTSEMIFSVRHLIAFVTRGITLEPGDIIATGTPAGVGAFRTPPVFLKEGDRVVVEVEGIGSLGNTVRLGSA